MLEKVRKVERIFKQLDRETEKFSRDSKLSCLANCTQCCLKKGLEANVLEFLPLAYHLVSNNLHEAVLDQLDQEPEYCINLINDESKRDVGGCRRYPYRGLICRLFGFSALRDKNERLVVYTCALIKSSYPTEFEEATKKINLGMKIPLSANLYSRLYYIDSAMAEDYNPINVSIRKAIEKVAYFYSNKPKRIRREKPDLSLVKET